MASICSAVSTTGHVADQYVEMLTGNLDDGEHRRAYRYDTHWLPHDAKHKTILHPLSFQGQMQALMPGLQAQPWTFDPMQLTGDATANRARIYSGSATTPPAPTMFCAAAPD